MTSVINLIPLFLVVFCSFLLFEKFICDKIKFFQKKGQPIRELGIQSHLLKQNTPTMGGIIIIGFITIFSLIFCKLIYIFPILFLMLGFFAIGLYDDIIKVTKQNHHGISAKTRLLLAVVVSCIFLILLQYLYPQFINSIQTATSECNILHLVFNGARNFLGINIYFSIFFIPFLLFVIVGTANSTNLTDGLDGLLTFPVINCFIFLLILTITQYATQIQQFLEPHMHIEMSKFLTIASASCTGFLWLNCKPAKIFMGDCGSLPLGATIAGAAIILKAELFLPIVGCIFVIETMSVITQVLYFKATGGKRIFKMSPLHHHYEKCNIPEEKIVVKFWIMSSIFLLCGLYLYYLI